MSGLNSPSEYVLTEGTHTRYENGEVSEVIEAGELFTPNRGELSVLEEDGRVRSATPDELFDGEAFVSREWSTVVDAIEDGEADGNFDAVLDAERERRNGGGLRPTVQEAVEQRQQSLSDAADDGDEPTTVSSTELAEDAVSESELQEAAVPVDDIAEE